MDAAKQIEKMAASAFIRHLRFTLSPDGAFKRLTTVQIAGEEKPVLLVGSAYRAFDDGHIIAVLNPDKALCDRLIGGCAYTHSILTEIVAKRCDLMVSIMFSPGKESLSQFVETYRARQTKAAKFVVH